MLDYTVPGAMPVVFVFVTLYAPERVTTVITCMAICLTRRMALKLIIHFDVWFFDSHKSQIIS